MKKRTSERRKPKSSRQVQYAALPYRAKGKSKMEIMLVTSRGTRRWIIPKGWPKRGMPPYDTAAKEAFEEGGVIGKVSKRPIGSYPYVGANSRASNAEAGNGRKKNEAMRRKSTRPFTQRTSRCLSSMSRF